MAFRSNQGTLHALPIFLSIGILTLSFQTAAGEPEAGPKMNSPSESAKPALEFLRRRVGPHGLLDSYVEDGTDRSYTYDNALAAMAFLSSGRPDLARKVLDAFKKTAPHQQGGFLEAYHATTGKPDGILTAGPNAYLLQAMNLYYARTKDPRYNDLARGIADYLLSHQAENGGLYGRADVSWKSTENNLGAYSALYNLGVIQKQADDLEKAQRIREFLTTACWDGARFLRGENDPSTVTDVQALGILVLGKDYSTAARWAESRTRVTRSSPGKQGVTGFDFNDDQDTVWTEGTLQMALAYLWLGDRGRARFYQAESEKLLKESGAMLLATNEGTTGIGWTLEPWQAVAPTAWYILLCNRDNVLGLEKD